MKKKGGGRHPHNIFHCQLATLFLAVEGKGGGGRGVLECMRHLLKKIGSGIIECLSS